MFGKFKERRQRLKRLEKDVTGFLQSIEGAPSLIPRVFPLPNLYANFIYIYIFLPPQNVDGWTLLRYRSNSLIAILISLGFLAATESVALGNLSFCNGPGPLKTLCEHEALLSPNTPIFLFTITRVQICTHTQI